jgi:hypothetical protein
MTLNEISALAKDATFQDQVKVAALSYASTALSAPSTQYNAADQKCWDLAVSTIVDGCTANLNRFIWGIATVPGFTAIPGDTGSANDAAINSCMITEWPAIAGVTAHDKGQ